MGKVAAQQKHANYIENGDGINTKASQNHVVNIMNFCAIRGANRGLEIIILRKNCTDGKVKEMENDKGKHQRTSQSHTKGRPPCPFGHLHFIGAWAGGSVFLDQLVRGDRVHYYTDQQE
tara:strand:+ start:1737 stop:2093 length:357 start_codon:yes stop_codon:yes gene_type:complete